VSSSGNPGQGILRDDDIAQSRAGSLRRFAVQTVALAQKNLLIARRTPGSTCVQLFIGVVFLFLLLILAAAVNSASGTDTDFTDQERANPVVTPPGDPTCVVGPGMSTCYVFAYATVGLAYRNETNVQLIVNATAKRMGLSPDSINQTFGFYAFPADWTQTNVTAWILANPNVTKAIVHFENSYQWHLPASQQIPFRYILQTNATADCLALGVLRCTIPMIDVHIPLMTALDAAFVATFGGPDTAKTEASFTNFPHPDLALAFDVMKSYGQLFIYIALTFLYTISFLGQVQEKEDHLVESMKQMGMMNSAYWAGWVIYTTIVNTIAVFLLMLFGVILRFDLFVKTDGQLMLTVLWLCAQSFTAMGFFYTALLQRTDMARTFSTIIFVVTFVSAPLLVENYYTDPDEDNNTARSVLAAIPYYNYFFLLGQLIDNSAGSTAHGLRWADLNTNVLPPSITNTTPTFWSLNSSVQWLVLDYFMYLFGGWYFTYVLPTEYGRRHQPWFLLNPRFWGIHIPHLFGNASLGRFAVTREPDKGVDPDVMAEAEQVTSGNFSAPPAVVVRGLSKHFGSLWQTPFKAVDNVYYSMPQNSLFALLGHNGSGKSTTFNALTGLTNVTAGDAEIFGKSVHGDMSALHSIMGVCPQHDVLWNQLTAREHLEMFATIKGFKGNVRHEAQKRIDQVRLQSAADTPCGGYSGGMRRRLSIAIALLGEPMIIFLDEPTTGMDPVTRAEVLQMISEAKRGRVIVLTSHAMEEVDLLADKIAVMSHGKMQAVGTSLRLKRRFGAGFKMTMFVPDKDAEKRVGDFMAANAPAGTKLASSTEGALVYQLPRQERSQDLVPFFRGFEKEKTDMRVNDYSLGLTTLEEVFLNLSQHNEDAELAKALGAGGTSSMSMFSQDDARAARNLGAVPLPNRTSLSGQYKALLIKSLTFQCRRLRSCLIVVLFPIVIMLALLVLDKALFDPLKVKAMCGQGVSAADCPTIGPDLNCLATLFEYEPVTTLDSVEVGRIDLDGFRGGAVNPNCDKLSCYDGLEKIDTRSIPVFDAGNGLGFVNQSSTQLFDWHADLLYLLSNRTCEDAYEAHFDASLCNSDQTCITNVQDLQTAEDWLTANAKQTFSTDACLRTSTGNIYTPPPAILDAVNAYQAELVACQGNNTMSILLPHFTSVSMAAELANITTVGQGVMGSFSMDRIYEPEMTNFSEALWVLVSTAGLKSDADTNTSTFATAGAVYLSQRGLRPDDVSYTPTLYDICSVSVWKTVLGAVLQSTSTATSVCLVALNLDRVRGLSTNNAPSAAELDYDVYHDWFGQEYQTQLMVDTEGALPDQERYMARQFYSRFGAYQVTFSNATAAEFDVIVYHNQTAVSDDQTDNWFVLQYLFDSAVAKAYTGRTTETRTQDMPVKFVCNRDAWLTGQNATLDCDLLPAFLKLSILDFVAAQLFPYIFMLQAYLIVTAIVYEKEAKLRIIMRINGGLRNSVYWLVNYLFYWVQFIIMSLLIYIIGRQAKLQFVSLHQPAVYWIFIFLWSNLLVAFSFLLSVAFSSSATATATVLLIILVLNIVGVTLIGVLIQDPNSTPDSYSSLMWLPPFVMIRVVEWMAYAGAFGQAITMQNLQSFGDGALPASWGFMVIEWFACVILVWYLDNVVVAGFGVRQPPLFFLDRKYWSGTRHDVADSELASITDPADVELASVNQADVKAEYERVVNGAADANLLVRIVRMHKRFGDFNAVKSLSLGVNRNECFGLLGHNGAGKTTAINMLVGLYEPTSGTALVDGLSIRTDMESVQTRMGVCPQHDVCWGPLTCREHVLFYARLKGVPSAYVDRAVDRALMDVNLKRFESRAAQALSGGMRRRLSVAMALIGSPKIVYLDEPSTGLDPASKRSLWNVVSRAKGDKSIVLTTHSMEEAEVLCDRIGIMALGELQCIGTAAELKHRFGAGYTFLVACSTHSPDVVEPFVKRLFPNAAALGKAFGGMFKYEVRREEVQLSSVFEVMESEATKEKLGLVDWSLTETTLEEVFLKLAEHAKVEETLSSPVGEGKTGKGHLARMLNMLRRENVG